MAVAAARWEPAFTNACHAGDPQAAAAGAEQPAEEDGEEQAPQKEKKAPAKRARKPKAAANPGTVKAGEATSEPAYLLHLCWARSSFRAAHSCSLLIRGASLHTQAQQAHACITPALDAKRPAPDASFGHEPRSRPETTCSAGAAQPGKRRVLKTTYNDKGEEVTEMVLEDDPNWQAPSQQAALARAGSAAGSGQDPESPAAAKRPSSQGQGKAKPAAKKAASAKGEPGRADDSLLECACQPA